MDAVWSSDLKPLQKLVAAVYADHARDQRTAWVTLARLTERSGLSRDAANRHVRELRDRGWLVVFEKASQHRATLYGLVIPESSGTSDVPLSSTADVPLTAPSSTSPDASSTPDDTSSTPRVPNQRSIKGHHHSSSSPARATAARLLGWDEEDDRLEHLDAFLASRNIGKAGPWLRACHDAGDLERIFTGFIEEQTVADEITEDAEQARVMKVNALWSQIKEACSYDGSWTNVLTEEARAMGRPADTEDPVLLRSVLATINHERRWSA